MSKLKNFFFSKKKIDELTRTYTILGFKFKRVKKRTPMSKLTRARIDDAVIALKCLRNLENKANTIETMVLGHSHARLGFIEDNKSINLGIDSQDLYYSFKLLEKYQSNFANLKNIVLFFALFSPGNDLENSPQTYRCAYYDVFYDIPYKNKFLAYKQGVLKLAQKLCNLDKKTENKLFNKLNNVAEDIMNSNKKNINPETLEQKWIKRWLDLNKRNTQIHFVEEMAKICKNRGFNFTIVLSPYNPRIKEFLPETNTAYKTLFEIVKKYSFIKVLDEYSKNDFQDEDFLDTEHLSLIGAKKMTDKINRNI